jgi:preprotein translocase subunit SecG
MSAVVSYLLMILLLLTALVLIVLVLIQRGKGGGLSGAFGGMGGQSAFGTKAGDLFTKITIGVAAFWIVLCIISVRVLGISGGGLLSQNLGRQPSAPTAPAQPSPQKPPAGAPVPGPAAPAGAAKTPGK